MPGRIVLRIGAGIAEHFPVRVSEWIMSYAIFAWGLVLWGDPTTFDRATSFTEMARWGDESTWAIVCFNVAALRFAALIVNGTFKEHFRHSPHLRGFASLAACIFWGQIVLGIVVSAKSGNGVMTGFVAYSTFMALDVWNLFRAWVDIGVSKVVREAS